MAHYHCYVLGPDGHISSRHDVEAIDDAEAMLKAAQVAPSEEPMVEVWCDARLVGTLSPQTRRQTHQAMTFYRFYLLRDGHTFPAEALECESDSAALEKAKELLAMSTTFHSMEVWQGSRKVGAVERG